MTRADSIRLARRRFSSQRDALTAFAQALGYQGRKGGWVYDPQGRPVAHGWDKFHARVNLVATARDLALTVGAANLEGMPLTLERNGHHEFTDLAYFAVMARAKDAPPTPTS